MACFYFKAPYQISKHDLMENSEAYSIALNHGDVLAREHEEDE